MKGTRSGRFLSALGLILMMGMVGCASGGSGGDSGGDSVYREDLGRVMVAPLTQAREKIFGKYTIPMYREEDTSRTIFWETQWLPRDPTPEESAAGVMAGRNRITMRGNYVEERMDGTPVLRVRFEAENQVRTAMNPEWHPAPMPPSVEERFEEIYNDLRLELRAGIIR